MCHFRRKLNCITLNRAGCKLTTCSVILFILRFIIIHQTAFKDNCLFLLGKSPDIKRDVLNTVCSNDLCGNFFLTEPDSIPDTGDKNIIPVGVIELSVPADCKGKDTPVDAVAAVTLCGELVADITEASEHLLTGGCLLSCASVSGTAGKDTGTELGMLCRFRAVSRYFRKHRNNLFAYTLAAFFLLSGNSLCSTHILGNTA